MIDRGYLYKTDVGYLPTDMLTWFPLFGSVQAGMPTTENPETKEDINIQSYLTKQANSTILLRVRGDSMEDEWIHQGDIVVVNTAKPARIGDIVIGIIDGDYTIKYLMQDEQWQNYLQAANAEKKYPDIYANDELTIYWVVTWSFRKYV